MTQYQQNRIYCSTICKHKYYIDTEKTKHKRTQSIKNTCYQKYGVSNISKLKETSIKRQNTCLQKYGVKSTTQLPETILKMQNTCLKRYGKTNSMQIQQFKQKQKQTCIQKYGVINTFQSEKTKQINRQLRLNEGFQKILTFKQFVIPLFTQQQYEGYNKIYLWQCAICHTQFQQKIYTTHFNKECDMLPRCPHCFPKHQSYSNQQKQLSKFCKQYFPNLSQNNFQLISPYQVDIYIQQLNLALQFNGSYWHSIQNKLAGYHLMKTKLCNEKNIRLIHIWQDEWTNNKQQIKQRLKVIFNKQQVIPINQCLDFSWFNNIDFNKYILKQQNQPKLINRNNFLVENCGTIILLNII